MTRTTTLDIIRAHLECARQGYPVHVGCGGECTPTSEEHDAYLCHRCARDVPFRDVTQPPGSDYYERDVTWLLEYVQQLKSNLSTAAERDESLSLALDDSQFCVVRLTTALISLHAAVDELMGDSDLDDDESPLMRAMQRAAQALEQPAPGTPIVQVDCPCCGAELDVQHGDEPGQVGVVGEAAP